MVYSITTFSPCLFRSTGGEHYRRLHLHSRKNMSGWLGALAHRIHIYKYPLPSFLHNLPYSNLPLCLSSVKKKLFLTNIIIFGNFVMSILSGKSHGIKGFDFSSGQRKRVSRENQLMVWRILSHFSRRFFVAFQRKVDRFSGEIRDGFRLTIPSLIFFMNHFFRQQWRRFIIQKPNQFFV
jgi:hypothetical protein